jgi:hypothetical protein
MFKRYKILNTVIIHAEQLLIIVLAAVATITPFYTAGAADLENRKVTIGTSRPSQVTIHAFNFDIISSTNIGSIEFEYCENSPAIGGPCTPPVGLDASSVALTNQAGETGFSIHPNTNANRIVITRAPVVAAPQSAYYEFNNVLNPSAQQQSVFVRISTYATDDATGARTDSGAVVFYVTRDLTVTGFVPPFLTFCVGVTVSLDCTNVIGDFINFGELLRTLPAVATSEYSAATNDISGYSVSVYGNTMTSGNNIIPELAANGPSTVGTSQYGLNLRRNNSPTIGSNPQGTGTAAISPQYNSPNSFRFVSGETLSFSNLSTDYNKMTVSYLINVSQAQSPGVYVTTMTYIAVADF